MIDIWFKKSDFWKQILNKDKLGMNWIEFAEKISKYIFINE